jgi:hypothetical protein
VSIWQSADLAGGYVDEPAQPLHGDFVVDARVVQVPAPGERGAHEAPPSDHVERSGTAAVFARSSGQSFCSSSRVSGVQPRIVLTPTAIRTPSSTNAIIGAPPFSGR